MDPTLPTNKPEHFTVQPCLKANSRSASQKTYCLSWNLAITTQLTVATTYYEISNRNQYALLV